MNNTIRNLLTRTGSGIIFVALFVGSLLVHPLLYCILFTGAIAIMMREYMNVVMGRQNLLAQALCIVTGCALFILVFLGQYIGLSLKWLFLLPTGVMMIYVIILFGKEKNHYEGVAWMVSSLLYIALPFAMTNLAVFDIFGQFNGMPLLFIMILIWTSDVGAYLFGITLGRVWKAKLFPSVSPKKSWAGYLGGLIVTLAAGWALQYISFVNISLQDSLILALIINITSTVGDLAESQFKRNFGVKDSGRIMPGHGGLLDRFDGALFAFPACVIYLILITV